MVYDPRSGPPNPEDAKELPKQVTVTTQWDCYNLLPGIVWEPITPGNTEGLCIHYDDSEYQRQLAEWEEHQANLEGGE